MKPRPSLVVVGTGIRAAAQLTPEARTALQRADRVLHVLTDPFAHELVEELNPRGASLLPLYARGKSRVKTYEQMVRALLRPLRRGLSVAAAFYGHPGVFAFAGHEAIRRARDEGYEARMLPGISAEDCLFADLHVDPATAGCQSYEATHFLLTHPRIEPTAPLVLWQVGAIGVLDYPGPPKRSRLRVLARELAPLYGPAHEVVLYEAAPMLGVPHSAHRAPLEVLHQAPVTLRTTLYVPPLPGKPFDEAMLKKLGMVRARTPRKKRV